MSTLTHEAVKHFTFASYSALGIGVFVSCSITVVRTTWTSRDPVELGSADREVLPVRPDVRLVGVCRAATRSRSVAGVLPRVDRSVIAPLDRARARS